MTACAVIWDFDWSLVNENTDTWVFATQPDSGVREMEHLKARSRAGAQWTALMDEMLASVEALAAALVRLPVFEEHIAAVKLVKSRGLSQYIVSDANTFYIDTILSHLGLSDCFDGIVTNPARVVECGEHGGRRRLTVGPHQPPETPHGCPMCPVNLCKGAVVERILGREGGGAGIPRCVYIGDGSGDLHACLCLRGGDVALN